MRMKHGSVGEVEQLMLASSLDFDDLLLTQSSRCRVGKLSLECGVMGARSRYCLAFDGSAQPLHCFFDFR